MRILKHSWVNHDKNSPIFSVDINPKGDRFATGGQGPESGRIKIWNFAPLLNHEDEVNPEVPKMLCQIDNHITCVNVVRWSCDGQFLASGDEEIVMIWKLSEEAGSSSFAAKKKNVENWKCIARLRGHLGDVFDLAWAPNDCYLATVSVDNTVVIWNARNFPEKVTVLRDHNDMVKGVTWDPLGQYLATQSADRTLRIWRTSDWSSEKVVSECFSDCSATTHVLRLSWSPEGQYLISAHAMNGGGPTAQIIDRNGWKQEKDIAGHRKAVTCVKFNPNILKKDLSEKFEPYCCWAVASRDCSLSVWQTNLKRPLINIKNLFRDSILDIAWSSNGLHLIACSLDGTIAFVDFSSKEIGFPLSFDEKNTIYEQMYGQSLQQSWDRYLIGKPAMFEKKMDVDDVIGNGAVVVPPTKQTETRLRDGRRKIVPINLTPVVAPSSLQIKCSSTDDEAVVCYISGDRSDFNVQVTNGFKASPELFLAKIEGFKNGQSTWETYLRSAVKCIAANDKMVVACCEDFTVNCLWSNSGSRVFAPFLLEDLVVSLTFNVSSVCLVLTKSAFIHMWNFETGTSMLNQISLFPLLAKNGSVNDCGLSETGSPIVTLEDGRVYAYSFGFKTWQENWNPLDPFQSRPLK